jgi:flagellar biosynthesis/type III secretory pathway protein FliH
MALLRPSELARLPREAIVLDLGDLASQGRQMCAAAQARANEIVAQARAERERILAGAREAGYAKGLEEGRAAGRVQGEEAGRSAAVAEWRDRLSKLDSAWTSGLSKFEGEREGLMRAAREDLLGLALQIAQRVVKRRVECDPGVVVEQVAAASAQLAKASGVILQVHPDDVALVEAAMPELARKVIGLRHARIAADPALSRGSCVVQCDGGGMIDATIETQLDRIARAIVPATTCERERA